MNYVFLFYMVYLFIVGVTWCREEFPCSMYHDIKSATSYCKWQCENENCETGTCLLKGRRACVCKNCNDKAEDNVELNVMNEDQ
ncbi:hypothetical protein RB195_007702 [Necator americanus]|uniref:Uncharacterized protein n=1 Tax=Necator americanus TaxID=51031 RepID=A0ABR1C1Q8_NECAM